MLFAESTPTALAEAVRRLEGLSFDEGVLRQQAERFSVPRFQRELDALLLEELTRR